jgi:hypothetical protein
MRDRPADPSIPVNADTPSDFNAQAVVERWEEIQEQGHPLGPNSSGKVADE